MGPPSLNSVNEVHTIHNRVLENTPYDRMANAEMDMKFWADKIDRLERQTNKAFISSKLANAKKKFTEARQRLEKAEEEAQRSSPATTANGSLSEGKATEDEPSSSLDSSKRGSKQHIGKGRRRWIQWWA